MDSLHLHLIINHFPIVGMIISLLSLSLSLLLKNDSWIKGSYLLLFLLGLSVGPVYLSGESAEDKAEDILAQSEPYIDTHAEAAEKSLVACVLAGLGGGIGLIASRKKSPSRNFSLALLLLILVAVGFNTWTGITGGKIGHAELRDSSISNQIDGGNSDNDQDKD